MPLTASVLKNTTISESFSGSHDQLQRSMEANLSLWRNAMTAGFNSVEAVGRCVTSSRDDFLDARDDFLGAINDAINTANLIEFSRRRIDALQDRHRKLLADLRSITDHLDTAWFQAVEIMSFPKTGATAEAAEVVNIVEGAHPLPASRLEAEASEKSDNENRRPLARGRQRDA